MAALEEDYMKQSQTKKIYPYQRRKFTHPNYKDNMWEFKTRAIIQNLTVELNQLVTERQHIEVRIKEIRGQGNQGARKSGGKEIGSDIEL